MEISRCALQVRGRDSLGGEHKGHSSTPPVTWLQLQAALVEDHLYGLGLNPAAAAVTFGNTFLQCFPSGK